MTNRAAFFTVKSSDGHYVSPLIGNGEVVTTIGPTGFHDGFCPEREAANRTIFWAGRRMNTPTHALVRFGHLSRTLVIDGQATSDDTWSQTIDYDSGTVYSTLNHGAIQETTRSLVCLTGNVLVFHTRLTNVSNQPVAVRFTVNYDFPQTVDPRQFFPQMTHLAFDSEHEVPASDQPQIRLHIQRWEDNSLSVLYRVDDQLGEARLGQHPAGQLVTTPTGGESQHMLKLAPNESADLWCWLMLSDRRKYTHFPDFDQVRRLAGEHERAWAAFWNRSHVETGDPKLDALRQTCLYAIRCNASPWSIPPAYLSTHWEGRTFHDEMYPFLALLSGGHVNLAVRIPNFRLNTLPVAVLWGGDSGARFPWETLENGHEGGPYGHWMDERFQVGQFSETAWRYYLYTRDRAALTRFYPLLRECAELFVQDVLVRDEHQRLKTRRITDFDEQVYPLENAIFTICSSIRTLENAALAAGILDVDPALRFKWHKLATELRAALPTSQDGAFYQVSDDSEHWHIAQAGVVFPFGVDVNSARARETITQLHAALRSDLNVTVINVPGDERAKTMHWMWAAGIITTAYCNQGRAEEGFALISQAPASAGSFLSPNERLMTITDGGYPWLAEGSQGSAVPWFTTGAGAVVFAIHNLFVVVDHEGTILFNGWPPEQRIGRFEGLLASDGVIVAGEIADGVLIRLSASSEYARKWTFRMPDYIAQATTWAVAGISHPVEGTNLIWFEVDLQPGITELI